MTLLKICRKAARKLSISVPTSIAAATSNKDAQLLMELANEEGYLLARRANWRALRKEHVFTTVAQEEQTGSLPDDYSMMVADTVFDRSLRRPVPGPITPQEWQQWKTNLIVPSDHHFMLRDDAMLIAPTPSAGHTIAYEYISTMWARDADGNEQEEFETDSDVSIFPFEIMKLAVIWRWKKHKGLAFEDDRIDYERAVADQIMRDGGGRSIHVNERVGIIRRGKGRIQDYDAIPT
jgi:hypothetical protein